MNKYNSSGSKFLLFSVESDFSCLCTLLTQINVKSLKQRCSGLVIGGTSTRDMKYTFINSADFKMVIFAFQSSNVRRKFQFSFLWVNLFFKLLWKTLKSRWIAIVPVIDYYLVTWWYNPGSMKHGNHTTHHYFPWNIVHFLFCFLFLFLWPFYWSFSIH